MRVPEHTRLRRDDQVEVAADPGVASITTDGTSVTVVLPDQR